MAVRRSGTLLKVLAGVCGALLLLCCAGVGVGVWAWESTATDTVGEVTFSRPLAVPPLAESHLDRDGRRVFDLRAQSGRRDFGPGGPTDTWGFNGDYLGPTLRTARGERVLVNVTNDLGEPTSVHWHGMHLPAVMDGGPHQPVEPGKTWSPTWRLDQPAATLWYHPHPHGATARHVYRGLAGMFIVDDESATRLGLPSRYGVDDIPVIVQDRRFERNGQFDESDSQLGGVGILGDTLLVNGTADPYLDVPAERVRLRLLNASNARVYDFGFADDRQFTLVGTDGGLLPTSYVTDRIRLSPGERAEIVVTVRPGERTVLRSYPPDHGLDALNRRFTGADDAFDVLQLRAAKQLTSSPPVPRTLVPVDRLDPADAVTTRIFSLSGRRINGEKMDMSRIDAVITKDTTEVWEVVKRDGTPHSFHVHDVQFQVLSVAGREPPPELRGWKDTILLAPREPVRIIARFAGYADRGHPYMFHCHLLLHEDQGMMGQFVVVEPGQQPDPALGGGLGSGSAHEHHDD